MESQFGSNSMREFEAKIPKNLGCPTVQYSFKLIMENVLVVLYQETKEIVLPTLLEYTMELWKGKKSNLHLREKNLQI